MSPDEQADLLEKAADRIEAKGLFKGEFWKGSEGVMVTDLVHEAKSVQAPCCTLGALYCVAPTDSAVDDAAEALLQYLHKNTRVRTYDVAEWNDRSSRTKRQVVETLRKAAKWVRTQ